MIPEIDVDELSNRRDAGVHLIDVREADEYAEGHVAGARFVALSELADRMGELPHGPLVIICKSGGRSLKACEFLEAQGRDTTNVAGGTMAWITSGREIRTGMERD